MAGYRASLVAEDGSRRFIDVDAGDDVSALMAAHSQMDTKTERVVGVERVGVVLCGRCQKTTEINQLIAVGVSVGPIGMSPLHTSNKLLCSDCLDSLAAWLLNTTPEALEEGTNDARINASDHDYDRSGDAEGTRVSP